MMSEFEWGEMGRNVRRGGVECIWRVSVVCGEWFGVGFVLG